MRVILVSTAMLLAFTFTAEAGGLADRCATKTGATSGAAFSDHAFFWCVRWRGD